MSSNSKFVAAGTRLGGTNLDFQIEQCVYKRKSGGIFITNRKRTWKKLLLAAHAIVSIENSADVSVIPSRNIGQHVVLMFTAAVGATPTAGSSARWTQKDIALCDTDSPLCYVDISIRATERELPQWIWCAGPGSSAQARHHVPVSGLERSCLMFTSAGILKSLLKWL